MSAVAVGAAPRGAVAASWWRAAHWLLVALVAASLALRVVLVVFSPDPSDDPRLGVRLIDLLSYFTIQSNILVLLASVAVLAGWDLGSRRHRAVRLASLVGITVTGVVYALLLGGDVYGWSAVAAISLHYVVPPLTLLIWLAVGPWPGLTLRDLGLMLVWPVAWVAYTLVRGALVGWYPYDFVDVDVKGAQSVAVMIGGIFLCAVVLGVVVSVVDRWLAARQGGVEVVA